MSLELVCHDCGCDFLKIDKSQLVMINDDLWNRVSFSNNIKLLCKDCIQRRLGRYITIDDLLDPSINYKCNGSLADDYFKNLKVLPYNFGFIIQECMNKKDPNLTKRMINIVKHENEYYDIKYGFNKARSILIKILENQTVDKRSK